MKQQSDETVKKLKLEIIEMKQLHVRVTKQLKAETDKYRLAKLKAEKMVTQLQMQDRKRNVEAIRKQQKYDQQLTVFKRKYEEAVAAKKVMQAQLLRSSRAQQQKMNDGKSQQISDQLKQFVSDELELVGSTMSARSHCDSLIEDRKELSNAIEAAKSKRTRLHKKPPVKRGDLGESDEPRNNEAELEELEEKIKRMEEQNNLLSTEIQGLQKKCFAVDLEARAETRWNSISAVNHKIGLKHLFDLACRERKANMEGERAKTDLEKKLEGAKEDSERQQADLQNKLLVAELERRAIVDRVLAEKDNYNAKSPVQRDFPRRSRSPRRRNSNRRRDFPRRREESPRRRDRSPRRRGGSPKRRDDSPRLRDRSPRRRDDSPRRRNDSPGRRDDSPRRRPSLRRARSSSVKERSRRRERDVRRKRRSRSKQRIEDSRSRSPRKEMESGKMAEEGTRKQPEPPKKKPVDLLRSRAGGAYIPPAKLRLMQQQMTDKTSEQYQRLNWERLKKKIRGDLNKVNVGNLVTVVRSLLQENIIRGKGLLVRSIMQAQAFFPGFSNVYAGLVAVINSQFPFIGELLVRRLVVQFKRCYRLGDKASIKTVTKFLAHLINQQVTHELLGLEISLLMLESPTGDSVEVVIAFIKECAQKMIEVAKRATASVLERLRTILTEATGLDKRTQYTIEALFQISKEKFAAYPAVIEELDLIDEDVQITHMVTLEDAIDPENGLNVFKSDPEFEKMEAEYEEIRSEVIGDEGESEAEGEEENEEEEEEGAEPATEANKQAGEMEIIDNTDLHVVAFRRFLFGAYRESETSMEYCSID